MLELLDAGINVIGAFNVQHLESLKDVVERITGITVRETIPDTFLKQADQVVNLDLATEDLLDRLQSGKIYAPHKVTTALANFFQADNLSTLRELALREVAESVDRASVMQHRLRAEPANSTAARVMVCLASSSPRRGTFAAWISACRPFEYRLVCCLCGNAQEAPHMINAEAQRQLHATIQKAMELGAEVVRLKGEDPVPALINFAKSHGVGYIVIGRSHAPFWKRLLRWAPMDRMVDAAEGFDLHIVSHDDQDLQL